MIIQLACDQCGSKDDVKRDIDSTDLCSKCSVDREIADLEREIEKKEKWLEVCHLAPLRSLKERLQSLKVPK